MIHQLVPLNKSWRKFWRVVYESEKLLFTLHIIGGLCDEIYIFSEPATVTHIYFTNIFASYIIAGVPLVAFSRNSRWNFMGRTASGYNVVTLSKLDIWQQTHH